MEKLIGPGRSLLIAAGIVLMSVFLMVIILPAVFTRSLSDTYNIGAVIGISLAIIIRLFIFFRIKSLIRKLRDGSELRKSAFILPGILLLFFGLIYSDGAFAFLNNDGIPYVSFLMFASVFCDIIAAVFTFISYFLNK